MNKYLYILGLVGAALFSACSNSDDLLIVDSPAIDKAKESVLIYEAGQNSEVPITLGIGQSRGYTRTPIDPTGVGTDGYGTISLAAGEYLRIFCLASGTQSNVTNIPTTVSTNLWNNDAGGELGGLLVKMNDVPAIVSSDNVSFLDASTLTSKKYYYPMADWMTYNFYGYYPKLVVAGHPELSQTTTINANTVEVSNYLIDGSQDLIWGRAHPEDAETVTGANDAAPYCAKYIRLKRNEVGEANIAAHYPKLKFEHKFVQFNFFVKAANATALTTLKGLSTRVTRMYIDNAIFRLKLYVASKDGSHEDGVLTMDGELDAVKTQLDIKKWGENYDRFGTSDAVHYLTIRTDNDVVSTKYANDGYMGYIMLPPPSISQDNEFKYKLVVNMEYTGGTASKTIYLAPPAGGFVAGKSYNIIIRVDSSDLD